MRIILIILTALLIVGTCEVLFDIVDIKCHKFEPEPIGYPVRICSVAFDDKGIIGKLLN